MKILIGCEYSGRVRDSFIKKGHDAISCDILDTISPGPHYKGNVLDIINDNWDMGIFFPPCTHLATSGARWFPFKQKEQKEAIDFFMKLVNSNIPKIAIENPVGIMSTIYRKPDQIIEPYMFGESYNKKTCLWLKNLPKLVPTNIVNQGEYVIHGGKRIPKWYSNREIKRDLTFQGIADGMSSQWG